MNSIIKAKRIGKPGVSPLNKRGTLVPPVGFGYIFIPSGVDRDNFVKTCFRTGRVTIIDDAGGGVIKDCYITNEALQNVQFPKGTEQMGQPVVWIAQGFQNQPMVVGTFPLVDKVVDRDDSEFLVQREWNGGILNIQGSAKSGTLFIGIEGSESGYLKISSLGDENSVLELTCPGTIQVKNCRNLQATAYSKISAELLDVEKGNRTGISANKDEVYIEANYGEGDNINSVKSLINGERFRVETVYGGKNYSSEVNSEGFVTGFEDSTVSLKEGSLFIEQGAAKIAMADGKVSWTNNSTGLKDLLKKIHDIIQNLTVSTASGPSGTPLPPTVLALKELDTLLTNFFNE